MANMEIERKFTIKELPADIDKYEFKEIEQGYLCTEPVVRVRHSGDKYYMTYKGSGLMEREEYNLPLNKEAYEHLIKKADGNIIRKKRYFIPIEGTKLVVELDIFSSPTKLIMAEVEFESTEDANAFELLPWFLEDVTDNPAYHNSNMSRQFP